MLKAHKHPQLVESLSRVLNETAKISAFFPEMVGEMQIETMLHVSSTQDPVLAEILIEALMKIIELTKAPVKYLVAAKILKFSETDQVKCMSNQNIELLMKLLHHIQQSQEITNWNRSTQVTQTQQSEKASVNTSIMPEAEDKFTALKYKALKFSYLALTNLILKTSFGPILAGNQLWSIFDALINYATFERDTQVNLRVLTLLCVHFSTNSAATLTTEICQPLVEFLMANLFQFRELLKQQEPFVHPLPNLEDFFFEQSDFKLTKMTAVKISICLSLKVLS